MCSCKYCLVCPFDLDIMFIDLFYFIFSLSQNCFFRICFPNGTSRHVPLRHVRIKASHAKKITMRDPVDCSCPNCIDLETLHAEREDNEKEEVEKAIEKKRHGEGEGERIRIIMSTPRNVPGGSKTTRKRAYDHHQYEPQTKKTKKKKKSNNQTS